MLIRYDPDEYKSVSIRHVCSYHKRHPEDRAYAGCTCSSSISSVRRSDEEIAGIKTKKRQDREDAILAEAELIKAMRGIRPKGRKRGKPGENPIPSKKLKEELGLNDEK